MNQKHESINISGLIPKEKREMQNLVSVVRRNVPNIIQRIVPTRSSLTSKQERTLWPLGKQNRQNVKPRTGQESNADRRLEVENNKFVNFYFVI